MSDQTHVQKIIPHLWFDGRAEEAADFYTSQFEDSDIGAITHYSREGFEIHGQPEGAVMAVEFELAGYRFVGLNGGPYFSFTPAISFFVIRETESGVDELWRAIRGRRSTDRAGNVRLGREIRLASGQVRHFVADLPRRTMRTGARGLSRPCCM